MVCLQQATPEAEPLGSVPTQSMGTRGMGTRGKQEGGRLGLLDAQGSGQHGIEGGAGGFDGPF